MRLKLIKSRSFCGYGLKATQERPIVEVDEKTAAALIKSGFFAALEGSEPPEDPEPPEGTGPLTTEALKPKKRKG